MITTIMCPPFPITTDGRPVLQTTNAAESFYIYLFVDADHVASGSIGFGAPCTDITTDDARRAGIQFL